MLERMDLFFERRLSEYDEHMRRDIAGAAEFYPFTAQHLPLHPGCRVLDLGCGTGLELEDYFALNPGARVTAIYSGPRKLDTKKAIDKLQSNHEKETLTRP